MEDLSLSYLSFFSLLTLLIPVSMVVLALLVVFGSDLIKVERFFAWKNLKKLEEGLEKFSEYLVDWILSRESMVLKRLSYLFFLYALVMTVLSPLGGFFYILLFMISLLAYGLFKRTQEKRLISLE